MKKKLYRSTDNSMLSGVLSGLADYFGLDASLWRVGFVLLVFVTSGAALLVYLIAIFIVPKEPAIRPLSPDEYEVR